MKLGKGGFMQQVGGAPGCMNVVCSELWRETPLNVPRRHGHGSSYCAQYKRVYYRGTSKNVAVRSYSSHKLLCGQFLKQVLQRACALHLRDSESPSFFVKEFRFS